MALSPDGKTLAYASWDNTIKLLSLATGKVVSSFKGHGVDEEIRLLAFSPDGSMLASGSSGEIKNTKSWDRGPTANFS